MTVLRYDGKGLVPSDHRPVEEFPIALTVNGRNLATLVASPHDLGYLVVGFLRMQGLIEKQEDIQVLSVCPDFGVANVRIRKELPEKLTPTLTSGCGTGVTFHLPGSTSRSEKADGDRRRFPVDDVFTLMDGLARSAEGYRDHGGIHSAAVGDGGSILLFAEDVGRHNTLDRIAGEALLKGIDLSGTILATSGRVSSEMAAKAAALGVRVIASRTSPTDTAVRMCGELGITLLGYVRGRRFNAYANPWRIDVPAEDAKIEGVTGVILAGGASRRMGSNKALLPYQGGRFIEAIHRRMSELFREVLVVTNTPELFDFLPCRKVPDLYPGLGSLAGIHSGLRHGSSGHVFAVACDMPHLQGDLIRHLSSGIGESDVVIPESDRGLEPLHALYGKGALDAIEESLRAGDGKVVSFFDRVKVRKVAREEVARFDPSFRSFRNINTPEEYFRLRGGGTADPGAHARSPGNRADRAES